MPPLRKSNIRCFMTPWSFSELRHRGRTGAVPLSIFLAKSGKLKAVGGDEYLIEVLEAVQTSARLEEFAADVICRSAERCEGTSTTSWFVSNLKFADCRLRYLQHGPVTHVGNWKFHSV